MKPRYRALTLAIHPTSRGFSWIAFENPFTIYGFGTVGARGADKNRRCMLRIERLLTRLTPEVVVLETFEGSVRSGRIAALGRTVVTFAAAEGVNVALYRAAEVRSNFAHMGAQTRHEIAEAVTRLFPHLKRHLPRKRRAWESEPWRLSLFCAAALALTHFQRDALRVMAEFGPGGG
jgi:Holliday junction resolvasome RuvABC endonuclease subunit